MSVPPSWECWSVCPARTRLFDCSAQLGVLEFLILPGYVCWSVNSAQLVVGSVRFAQLGVLLVFVLPSWECWNVNSA